MTKLAVYTLGTLQLTRGDQPFSALRQRKSQALLVYLLAQRDQFFTREHLQLLLWSDSPAAKARANLRQTLRRLRLALPDDILSEQGMTIGILSSAPVWCDLDQLDQQLDLYRGEFLRGFALKNAAGWDEWLQIEREQVATRFVQLLHTAATAAIAGQQFDQAITQLQRALTVHPWQEQLHRALMHVHVRLGDRAAALAQYETLRQLLADELGAEPDSETLALVERIRQDELPRRHNLPATNTPFFGRSQEKATIIQHLQAAEMRLITLVGLGGIGKTRLALEVARAVEPRYPDGVWFVDLTPLTDSAELPNAIIAALGLPPARAQSAEQYLHDTLQSRQLLLLLDNFEHLLPDTSTVAQLVQTTPTCQFLITSRERLNIATEQTITLHGIGDGVALFVERARRNLPTFRLSAENQPAIEQICHLLEGMPLGIELAAAWVRLLDVATIAAEIERDLHFLQTTQRDATTRQASLIVIFEQSLARLSPHERSVLQALAIFRPGFDALAARAVTGGTLLTLLGLVDKSLLQRMEGQRFRLHERLRQLLRQENEPSPLTSLPQGEGNASPPLASRHILGAGVGGRGVRVQWNTIRDAHATHYATWAYDLLPKLQGEGQQTALSAFSHAQDNIFAAWQRAVDQPDRDWLDLLIEPLSLYYKMGGRFHEGLRLFQTAFAQLGDVVRLQVQVGSFLGDVNEYAAAQRQLEGVLNSAEIDPPTRLFALNNLAIAHAHLGDLAAGRDHFAQALQVSRAIGDTFREAGLLNNLGMISQMLDESQAAFEWYEQSVAAHRAMQDMQGLAMALNNHAVAAGVVGEFVLAEQLHVEALQLRRDIDDSWGVRQTLNNLAVIGLRRLDLAMARHYLDIAMGMESEQDSLFAHTLRLYSRLERLAGNVNAAIEMAQRSLTVALKTEHRTEPIYSRGVLAEAWFVAGSEQTAQQHYEQAVAEADGEANVLHELMAGMATARLSADPRSAHQTLTWLLEHGEGLVHRYWDLAVWHARAAASVNGKKGR